MTPEWLNDAVRAFGRQMGLTTFALNERGVAALRFENGTTLRFEYANESLTVAASLALPGGEAAISRLFTAVHPDAGAPMHLRAVYLAKSGEGVYAVRLAEREVNVTAIEGAFRVVWGAMENLRRSVS